MYLFNCMIIEKRKNSVYFMSIFPSEFAYYVIGHLSLRIPFFQDQTWVMDQVSRL